MEIVKWSGIMRVDFSIKYMYINKRTSENKYNYVLPTKKYCSNGDNKQLEVHWDPQNPQQQSARSK